MENAAKPSVKKRHNPGRAVTLCHNLPARGGGGGEGRRERKNLKTTG
jgi:hypothetical protein